MEQYNIISISKGSDYVLVHAGFALSKLDKEERLRAFNELDKVLREIKNG